MKTKGTKLKQKKSFYYSLLLQNEAVTYFIIFMHNINFLWRVVVIFLATLFYLVHGLRGKCVQAFVQQVFWITIKCCQVFYTWVFKQFCFLFILLFFIFIFTFFLYLLQFTTYWLLNFLLQREVLFSQNFFLWFFNFYIRACT